jgi:preprotein translocase subunit SecE
LPFLQKAHTPQRNKIISLRKGKAPDGAWCNKIMAEKKENRLVKYFKGVKSEFKKVTWPSWGQLVNNTGTVIAAVVIVGVFIAALDFVFGYLLQTFIV